MNEIKARKAFVTGGAGFLGCALVERLLRSGWSVRALVRSPASAARLTQLAGQLADLPEGNVGELNLVHGDLADEMAVVKGAEESDVVFHLASGLSGGCPVLFRDTVFGTRLFLERIAHLGIGRFVHVSSLSVYAGPEFSGQEIDEDHPIDPLPHLRDPYAYSKIEQERVVRDVCDNSGIELVVIRPGVIYGPHRELITGRIGVRIGGVLLAMRPRRTVPYIHVSNCADAIELAGVSSSISGQTFNVVDDDLPTARRLIQLRRQYRKDFSVVSIPGWALNPLALLCERYHEWSRGQIPAVLTRHKVQAMWSQAEYSNVKAKTHLGWNPAVALDQALAECFAAMSETVA